MSASSPIAFPPLAGAQWIPRAGLAVLFLYSGAAKVLDLQTFATGIAGYDLLPPSWVVWTALWIPWLEIWSALALWISRPFRSSAYWVMTGMLVVFTFAKISGVLRGLDISCGCTGSDAPLTWGSVAVNGLWLSLAMTGLLLDRRIVSRR